MTLVPRFEPSPLHVLVKQTDDIVGDDKQGSIIIPDVAKVHECAKIGLVVAVGAVDPENVPLWRLGLGDLVLFHVHASLQVRIDGDDYLLLDLDSVLGRLNPKDE